MIDLRDLEAADSKQLLAWRLEPEVDRWMSAPGPSNSAQHQRWFTGLLADPDRRGWVITSAAEPVGFLLLSGLRGAHRRAEWGWYIGEAKARGRGAGRAAQALGLDRAFHELEVDRIWSEVLADNDVALRAQAAAGFRREGYLRGHVRKDERVHDVVILGFLKREWMERRRVVWEGLIRSGLSAPRSSL